MYVEYLSQRNTSFLKNWIELVSNWILCPVNHTGITIIGFGMEYMLFIRTKHNMQIFNAIAFIKLQNET